MFQSAGFIHSLLYISNFTDTLFPIRAETFPSPLQQLLAALCESFYSPQWKKKNILSYNSDSAAAALVGFIVSELSVHFVHRPFY